MKSMLNYIKINLSYFLIALLCLLFAGCGGEDKSTTTETHQTDEFLENYSAFQFDTLDVNFAKNDTTIALTDLQDSLEVDDTIRINNILMYIIETDILLSEKEYKDYQFWKNYAKKHKANLLTGEIRNGVLVKWSEKLPITYCINRNSFLTEDHYLQVKNEIAAATSDWEKTCNIKFKYLSEYDNSNLECGNENLTFSINFINNPFTSLIASAFFPYDKIEERKVIITPQYFLTSASTTGILRHEIGHILGFRHEHMRSESPQNCRKYPEKGTLNPITNYDSKSVMHYLCADAGSPELLITELDKEGAIQYYGPPN